MMRKKRRRQFYPLVIGVVHPLNLSLQSQHCNAKKSLKLCNMKAYWKSKAVKTNAVM